MKITKEKLRELIKEELQEDQPGEGRAPHHQILDLIFQQMPGWKDRKEGLARQLDRSAALLRRFAARERDGGPENEKALADFERHTGELAGEP
jgi:hypothetical protein